MKAGYTRGRFFFREIREERLRELERIVGVKREAMGVVYAEVRVG